MIIQEEHHDRKITNPPPCMTTSILVHVLFISSKQKWYLLGFKSKFLNVKTITNTNAAVLKCSLYNKNLLINALCEYCEDDSLA